MACMYSLCTSPRLAKKLSNVSFSFYLVLFIVSKISFACVVVLSLSNSRGSSIFVAFMGGIGKLNLQLDFACFLQIFL